MARCHMRARRWYRRDSGAMAMERLALPGGRGITLAALGLAGILISPTSPPGPAIPVLNGDYNLAVAQFTNTVHGDIPADVAAEVANFVPGVVQGVRTALERSTPRDSDVGLLRIDVQELPLSVSGTQPDDQLSDARSVAAKSNADAVLFGVIANDGAAVVVAPRLWLSWSGSTTPAGTNPP
jgi:hypothetical protein